MMYDPNARAIVNAATMNRQMLTLATALGCGVTLYLIETESPPSPLITISKTSTVGEQSAEVLAREKSIEEDELSAEQQTNESAAKSTEPAETALELDFHAPFPDRVNLFQAPKRQGKASANSIGQTESSVELLGFVNVGSNEASFGNKLAGYLVAPGRKHGRPPHSTISRPDRGGLDY